LRRARDWKRPLIAKRRRSTAIISFLIKAIISLLVLTLIFAIYSFTVIFKAHYQTKKLIDDLSSPDFLELSLEDFSLDQLTILLSVEDPVFYTHRGYDFFTPGAGWTTITEGLVKWYYFDNYKPGLAKIRQILIAAFVLDPVVSKDNQLRLFINKVYLGQIAGRPVEGFASASRVYFHKEFSELGRDEYMALVAMIIAPETVNVIKQPDANAERVKRIAHLVDDDYLPKGWLDVWLDGCR
jgi:membrane carboxypeptidase/penicillin-binding protein